MIKKTYNFSKNMFFYIVLCVFSLICCSFIFNQPPVKSETWVDKCVTPNVIDEDTKTYYISYANELAYIAKACNSGTTFEGYTVCLSNNIDLKDYDWVPIGNAENSFKGDFDGNGYIIYNLTISNEIKYEYSGLFGMTSRSNIKNVTIRNASIANSTTNDSVKSAILIGYAYYNKVSNCWIQKSEISVIAKSSIYAGIAIGHSFYSQLENIQTSSSSQVIGLAKTSYVGGVTGFQAGGGIYGCSCIGSYVLNNSNGVEFAYAGGIAGFSSGSITESYNTSQISAGRLKNYWMESTTETEEAYAGGIVGKTSSVVSNCYNKGMIIAYAKYTTKSETTLINQADCKFAEGVNGGFDIWIKHGNFKPSDGKGTGDYKNKTSNSTKWYSGVYAYRGGIAGYSSSYITDCYNKGTFYGKEGYETTHYELYFKWKANSQYNLWMNSNISYDSKILYGQIVGYCSNSVSDCYVNESKFEKNSSFSFKQTLTNGGKEKINTHNSWNALPRDVDIKGTKYYSEDWYLNKLNSCGYYTYHTVDPSSVNYIYLNVQYRGSKFRPNEKTYFSIYTGLSSSTLSEKISNGNITVGNLGDVWAVDSKINDGDPYLKNLYWQNVS